MPLLKLACLALSLTACISEGTNSEESPQDEAKAADLRAQCETVGQIITAPDATFTITCGLDDL